LKENNKTKKMGTSDTILKDLKKIKWFLIVMGIIELFVIIVLSKSFLGLIIGLSTILPAYIALDENRYKWSYGMGIWGVIKYSPLTWIASTGFIFGDIKAAKEDGVELMHNALFTCVVALEFLFVLLVILSFIFSIMLIRFTSKQVSMNNLR
jgi:hypothetical protein